MHSTDFLVWNNFGAELTPAEVSCTGLGTYLLGWAGLPGPCISSGVRRYGGDDLYRERLFVAADGTLPHASRIANPWWRRGATSFMTPTGNSTFTGQLTEQMGLS